MSELLHFLLDRQQQFRRARLASLYSDFRHLQTVNPDGYAANITAWQQALSAATREGLVPAKGVGNDLSILNTGEQLLQELESQEWGRPLALGAVINESLASKQIVPLPEFLSSKTSVFHTSWIVTPWHILSWGLRQLGLAGGVQGEDKLAVGQFVLRANVEECAQNILKHASNKSGSERIYSKPMFKSEFSRSLNDKIDLSETDLDIVLIYLARDRRDLAYDGKTIKFKSAGEALTDITSQDATIATLKTLIADHTAHIAGLTERIDALSSAARIAVSAKNKVSALSSLRSKKLAESTLSRRSEMLGQLEEVYNKIEQAADQVETMRVMEASSGVLRSLNAEMGGVERAERVVDQLRDEMDQVNEVGTIISEAGQAQSGVDESEVDDELEAMEKEQREANEKEDAAKTKERLASLGENDLEQNASKAGEATTQTAVDESVADLGRLSLEEEQTSPSKAAEEQMEEMNTS